MSLWAAALLAPCAMAQALSTAEAADAGAGSDAGASFPIHGESVRHAIPAGWRLAWMAGDRDGNGHAIAKYIPADEDITHWRRGYRVITRLIAPARIQAWMKALTATTLCGAQQQPACRGAGR